MSLSPAADRPAAPPDAADLGPAFAALPGLHLVLRADAPRYTILEATDAYLAATLTTREQVVGRGVFEAFTDANPANPLPSGVRNLRASLDFVVREGRPHRMGVQRYDVAGPDGAWAVRHWAPRNTPVPGPDGAVRAIVHTVEDVTEREEQRRAMQSADAELALFAALTEHSNDAQFLLDERGQLLWANRLAAERLGYTRAELMGLDMGVWHPRVPSSEFPAYFARARRGRVAPFESVHRRKDGSEFPVEITPTVVELPDGARMLAAVRDISERKRAEAERERLLRELAAASQAKGEFLATMSHEIRTPINAITGYAELLTLGLGGPVTDVQRDYLDRLTTAGRHLLGLVNDILDLTKLEAGEFSVAREPGETAPVVAAAIDLVRPQGAARGVRVVDANPGHSEPYVGDEHRVRQVLVNLLGNAVKFTDAGGTVLVRCGRVDEAPPGAALRARGPWVAVRVTDTGVGIAPEAQAAVFEPFHQVEQGRTRTRGGTGLGLAISRRLARRMGGDLTLESAPGRGSTFTLWLPAAETAGAAEGHGAAPNDAEPEAAAARRLRVAGGPGAGVRGLGEVGWLLRAAQEEILAAYAERLRQDARAPQAAAMETSALEDHMGAFLSDLAQTLIMAEYTGGPLPDMLADGSAIARVVAERHGARRAAQGWDEAALRRDYAVAAEVIARVLRSRAGATDEGDVEPGLAVVLGFVARGEATAVAAWRAAGEAQPAG